MTLTRRTLTTTLALAFGALASTAFAQTKWDLPAGYAATNFHSINLTERADPGTMSRRKPDLTNGTISRRFHRNDVLAVVS